MLSVRLPEDIEPDLTQFCASRKLTKSQVVQEALAKYMVVYAELAGHPAKPAHLDQFVDMLGLQMLDLSRPPPPDWQAWPCGNTASAVAPKPVFCPISSLVHMPRPMATNCSPATRGATRLIFQRSN